MITSFRQAEALFAKARKPENGKPLEAKGWRLYKDGDGYTLKASDHAVARVQPDNTLKLVLPDDVPVPQAVTSKFYAVLPFILTRRSAGHHRIHPVLPEREGISGPGACGYANWKQLNTGGYRLYDGMTFDLRTRTPVGYREPQLITDPDRNKDWLRKSKALKLHLKTMVKLGAFDTMSSLFANANRWELCSMLSLAHHERDEIKLFVDALDGENLPAFFQRVGESICLHYGASTDTAAQLRHIDAVFSSNSLTLRKALGVVTRN